MQIGCTGVSRAQGRKARRTPGRIGLIFELNRIIHGTCGASQVILTFHFTIELDE